MPDHSDLPCQRYPELFFAERPTVLEEARALCVWCPVRALCLVGAMERAEPHGVWGGQIFVGGQVVTTKRGRGRPKKSAPEKAA
ncbi:MAG TPA: WhiB family transcriptional regulator [Marmoricola sp.]|jgi:WhiB family redox-sensing transcriptional regulator|nr:WhiB family transcriptional regulator [Marmoricola sp.]